jgi:DNA-binding response OmpR family regulator
VTLVPEKILLVDVDPAERSRLREVLTEAGLDCVVAGSDREALATIEGDSEIAVVVTDVVMPDLDGVRLGRYIRDRFRDRAWLQLLFVTRCTELDLAVSALRLGAVDYLTKPVAPDELVFAVSRALAASRAVVSSRPRGHKPIAGSHAASKPGAVRDASPEATARYALEYLTALRRLRRESGVLARLDEASWLIVIEVYLAAITGRRLSVSKLCSLDEASHTTAWRRIRSMEQSGLLVRDQDPADARRSFVSLTDAAVRAVADFMARADGLATPAG